jgi:DNA-binding transcriptional LysR family regulator
MQKDIDLSITVEGQRMKKLISHKLYKDHYAFYCSSEKTEVLDEVALKEMTLFYIPDAKDSKGRSLKDYIDNWGLSFVSVSELDSFEVVAEFIKRNYGVGILPVQVAKTYGSSIKQMKIKNIEASPFGEHSFYLSHREDLDLPDKYIKSILKASQKAVKKMLES